MKKILAATAISLLSLSAHADIIKCSFTEPFYTSTYSMSQNTLKYSGFTGIDGKEEITTITGVSFQIKGPGVFELYSRFGKLLQTITLNNQGSDGMSDNVYPYEVKDNSPMMKNAANNAIGGCSSNYLKVKKEN